MSDAEQKPCPFCGASESMLYKITGKDVHGFERPEMFCDACKAIVFFEDDSSTGEDETEDRRKLDKKLLEGWNNRPTHPVDTWTCDTGLCDFVNEGGSTCERCDEPRPSGVVDGPVNGELREKLLVTIDHDQEGRYGEMCDGQYECVCDDEFEPYDVPIAYTAERLIDIIAAHLATNVQDAEHCAARKIQAVINAHRGLNSDTEVLSLVEVSLQVLDKLEAEAPVNQGEK